MISSPLGNAISAALSITIETTVSLTSLIVLSLFIFPTSSVTLEAFLRKILSTIAYFGAVTWRTRRRGLAPRRPSLCRLGSIPPSPTSKWRSWARCGLFSRLARLAAGLAAHRGIGDRQLSPDAGGSAGFHRPRRLSAEGRAAEHRGGRHERRGQDGHPHGGGLRVGRSRRRAWDVCRVLGADEEQGRRARGGDAFHPGCEMTWPVRQISMYRSPFRLAHAPDEWVEPDYGLTLTFVRASAPDGCLGPQLAGGLSRWMAVPWQCDTASCRSGYDKTYDPYVPTFWPARVPNQVLTLADYQAVMDKKLSLAERQAAFARRADWNAPLDLSASYVAQINTMIAHFDRMGVVESRPG